ncbi:uncharacterized protein LOC115890314 [Sitophilus oryzae]|uniref:Uncharacterized protein LOC115890314 n=1 Tax=Sitophilus oryzae TaxID=7048 RepID=A0A6J2YU43_SITOR|nr:uncharacterized protein LOC115890314 [Sitophilus oryzae]
MAAKVVLIFFCGLIIAVNCGVLPSVKVLQGPGSKTTLYGPDGSSLKSKAPGGTVLTDTSVPAGLVPAGPAILPASPEVIIGDGPAGKIVTSYTLAGPGFVAAVRPDAAIIAVPSAIATGPIGPLPLPLSGLGEGKYIASASEALYDDGSYKEGKY